MTKKRASDGGKRILIGAWIVCIILVILAFYVGHLANENMEAGNSEITTSQPME